jgi:membrane protein DedA with SNARE-associated domain
VRVVQAQAQTTDLSPAQLRQVKRSLTILAVLGSGSLFGVAFWFWLANNAPLLLVALSPLGRHIMLAAPITNHALLVVVSVLRRMCFYGASFQLGKGLGPAGVTWIEARAGRFGRYVVWVERLFARWSKAVVLLAPGPTTSMLAGMSGMPLRIYVPLAATGLTLRVIAMVVLAEYLREPILSILAWVQAHWVEGTAVMVAGVLIYQWIRIRRGRSKVPALSPESASQESAADSG